MANRNSEKGLTLIEMSVVLVIISLLIIGIFTGKDIYRHSQVLSIVKDIENITNATDNFKEKYGYIAGDMPNAGDYWTAPTGGWTGDGDNIIDNNDERWEAWAQLSLADMIPGDFSAEGGTGGKATPNINVPSTKIDNGGYYLSNTAHNAASDPFFGRAGNFILIGLDSGASGNLLATPILSPREAWDVDAKIDNGSPDSGNIFGIGLKANGNGCVTNGWEDADAGGDYLVDSDEIACWLVYFPDAR